MSCDQREGESKGKLTDQKIAFDQLGRKEKRGRVRRFINSEGKKLCEGKCLKLNKK